MCACVGGAAPLRKLGAVPPTSYMWRMGAGGVNMVRKGKNTIPPGVPHASLGHRRVGRVRHRLGVAEAAPPDHVRNRADGSVRGETLREAPVPAKVGLLGRAAVGARRVLCAVVSLALSCSLAFGPCSLFDQRLAYALDPLSGIVLTGEFLSNAFAAAGAALTGVTLPGLGVAAVVGGTVGYAVWANDNPDEAQAFEQALRDGLSGNVSSTGIADQIRFDVSTLPQNVKESIVDYAVTYSNAINKQPVIPENYAYNKIITNTLVPDFIDGKTVSWSTTGKTSKESILNNNQGYTVIRFTYNSTTQKYSVANDSNSIYFYGPVVCTGKSSYNLRFQNQTSNIVEYQYLNSSNIGTLSPNGIVGVSTASDTAYFAISGIDLGAGFNEVSILQGVNSGLNTAFNDLVLGNGTAGDVVSAGGVTAVNLPGVTIDTATGQATISDVSGLTYADVAIANGGSVTPDVPLPGDVLSGLQSIITLLTQTFDVVTGIPPYLSATLENGTIIDIPHTLNDILGAIIDIPPTLEDLLDGVTIDIPAAIDDAVGAIIDIPGQIGQVMGPIVGGIPGQLTGLQGTLSNVLSGVTALPGTIAGALGLDWVLDGVDELKERLPEIPSGLVLPQATFAELQSVMGDYRDNTPVGKVFDAYEGVFDVMSEPSGGPPRYEIVFPAPINWSFVIDFAIFDGQFVMLSHAIFYLLAVFWYLKFLKTVRGWYEFFCGWGSKTLTVAEVQSMHDEGVY